MQPQNTSFEQLLANIRAEVAEAMEICDRLMEGELSEGNEEGIASAHAKVDSLLYPACSI